MVSKSPVGQINSVNGVKSRDDAVAFLQGLNLHAVLVGEEILAWRDEGTSYNAMAAILDCARIFPADDKWGVWWQDRSLDLPEPQFNNLAGAIEYVVSSYLPEVNVKKP